VAAVAVVATVLAWDEAVAPQSSDAVAVLSPVDAETVWSLLPVEALLPVVVAVVGDAALEVTVV
jgi:hypothetical protein